MATGTAKHPILRRSIIVLCFFALVAFFFALNFLLYIPRQQQRYNKKIFRALHEISGSFESSLESSADHYLRTLNKNDTIGKLKLTHAHTAETNFKGSLYRSFRKFDGTRVTSRNYRRTYQFKKDIVTLSLTDTTNAKVTENPKPYHIPIHTVFESTIEKLHKNMFRLLLLVKRDVIEEEKLRVNDQVIFKCGTLATEYFLPGDSLFRDGRFGRFSSIHDVPVEGTTYKAFALPFQFSGQELILLGFLEEKEYKSLTTRYPYPVLIWIASLLVLVILVLPFVKILLSSRQERITGNDVRMLMVALVLAPLYVILAAAALQIYRAADKKTDSGLYRLNNGVKKAFMAEIDAALQQLKHYDRIVSCPNGALLADQTLGGQGRKKWRDSAADFKDIFFYPTIYKNLDDVYWMNDSGIQIAKWFLIKEPVSYLDLSERAFFRNVQNGNLFARAREDSFYIEPTISWATGAYNINIVKRSNQTFSKSHTAGDASKQASMIGLATRMYSVFHPVVLHSYNFCIINKNGDILFHSETERSLHENLFDESNRNRALVSAVFRQDSVLIRDAELFGRDVKLLVTPMNGMPGLYLASYVVKREQNAVVFHVTIFAFLCSMFTLLGLLLFLLLTYFATSKSSALKFYTYESAWIKPSKKKTAFYQQILFFLAGLLVLLGLFFLPDFIAGVQNQSKVLQAAILLPFFVSTGYYLIKREYNHQLQQVQKKEAVSLEASAPYLPASKKSSTFLRRNRSLLLLYTVAMLFLLLTIFTLLYGRALEFDSADFLAIPLIILVPVLAWYAHVFQSRLPALSRTPYLGYYTLLVFLSILLISVAPVLGFLSYALKEETEMRIKAEQFRAAKRLEARRDSLNTYFKKIKPHPAPKNADASRYMRDRKLAPDYGIYLLNQTLHPLQAEGFNNYSPYEGNPHFYRALTWSFLLPKDHADFFDNNASYRWLQNGVNDSLKLVYKNNTDPATADSVVLAARGQSRVFAGMFRNYPGRVVFLGVLVFFAFLYKVIKSITKKIFLLDYFECDGTTETDRNWMDKFYQDFSLTKTFSAADKQFLGLASGAPGSAPLPLTTALIQKTEQAAKVGSQEGVERILRIQHLLAPAYDAIWRALRNDEQFVLYDFALDSYTNYRNVDVLYSLYQKGIIRKEDQQLVLMNYSFRNYVMGKAGTVEMMEMERQFSLGSNWKNVKNIFYVSFFAVMIFLFTTQQEVSNKILAMISGLVTLVPLLLRLFDKNVADNRDAGKEKKAVY